MNWIDQALSVNGLLFSIWMPVVVMVGAIFFICIYGFCALLRYFGLYHPALYQFSVFVPWRPFYLLWNGFSQWWESIFSFGKTATAKFSGNLFVLANLYTPEKVLLGRPWLFGFGWFQPVGIKIIRHMVMVAGTGSGKTVQTQTLLGLHGGAAFIIDPKYQIMDTMTKGRKALGAVFQLTPLRENSNSWNVFDEIEAAIKREGKSSTVRYFTTLAETLILKQSNEKPFFVNSERGFLAPLIAFVYINYLGSQRSLIRVRDLLMNGLLPEHFKYKEDAFEFLLDEMEHCDALDGFISKGATALRNTGKETQGNILAGVRAATKWLDFPEIRSISEKSDFLLCDLKTDHNPPTVFLGAPTTDIQGVLSPWFRMITTMGLTIFEHMEGNLKQPCLFALDEMPSLGTISQLEISAAVLRSFGVRLLVITQDIDLLKKTYPQTWESFIGNADVVWWMGTNHNGNIDYLAKILGNTTRKEKQDMGGKKKRIHYQERPLMYHDQIRRFLDSDRKNTIVTRYGKRPMCLKIAPHHKELPIWLYDADKNFKEPLGRVVTRKVLDMLNRLFSKHKSSASNTTHNLTLKDAQALFGLSGQYSRADIKTRADMLQNRFNPDLVAKAKNLLEKCDGN